ncbi:MAG: hypothetical protein U9R01_06855, partial [candidate division WOR-3 bacterium]|nr:hypothetical protein [candidate division WOR-3 bacterium]
MKKEIEVKKKQKLQQEAQDLLSVASELKVTTQGENEAATEYLKIVKAGKKKATEFFDARIKPLYKTYKTLNGDKKKVVDRFTDAEREVKSKMG